MVTTKEIRRDMARYRAYREAVWRYTATEQAEKAAALLPRLKLAEAELSRRWGIYKKNNLNK